MPVSGIRNRLGSSCDFCLGDNSAGKTETIANITGVTKVTIEASFEERNPLMNAFVLKLVLSSEKDKSMMTRLSTHVATLILCLFASCTATFGTEWEIGASRVDVTPDEPVRLSGYASRIKPSEGIDSALFVRSLYMKHSRGVPLLIVSADAIGISAQMTEEIGQAIKSEFGIARSQVVLCTTHSHTAPHLDGVLTNLFADGLSGVEKEASRRYTKRLIEAISNRFVKPFETLSPGLFPSRKTTQILPLTDG